MTFLRSLRPLGFALLIVSAFVSCGDSGGPTDGGSEARLIATTLHDATLAPGEVATLTAAEAVFAEPEYVLSVDGVGDLRLVRADASTLHFALPAGTAPGAYSLELRHQDDWRIAFDVDVIAAPAIGPPDVVVDDRLAELDSMRAEVAALIADTTLGELGGASLIAALDAEITAWRDTASAESLERVAAFLAANPGLFDDPLGASGPAGAAAALEKCSEFDHDPTAIFISCQGKATFTVGRAAVAVVAAAALCAVEPTATCAIASGAAIYAAVRAKGWVLKLTDQPALVVGHIFAKFWRRLDLVGPSGSAPAFQDTTGFMSGVEYTLSPAAPFRSVVAGDASLHPVLSAAIDAIETLDAIWRQAEDVVAALRNYLFPSLPPLPVGAGAAPSQPKASTEADVPVASITVDNVTAGVTVDYDPATGAFTATTDQPGDVAFAYDLVYAYAFGTVRTTHFGVVTPSAVISAVSGSGQEGKPGEPVADSLVVRVTSLLDGSGVADAAITWAVTAGGGSIDGQGVTDADGYARAHWVLGTDEGAQTVSATGRLADGGVPAENPVTFGANAQLDLQLVLVHGDDQVGDPHTALEYPLVARVVDQDLMPIEGRTIEWRVATGDGTLSAASTVTDANGEGQVTWTMGEDSTGTVEASLEVSGVHVEGSPIVFSATTLELQLVLVHGDNQVGQPYTALEYPLVARVVDQDLMPIEGRTIEWRVASGDGTISAASTVTDANGEAQVTWTMGEDSAGTVEASFMMGGVHAEGSPVVFHAVVDAGGPVYEMTVIPSLGYGNSYAQELSDGGYAVGFERHTAVYAHTGWVWHAAGGVQAVTVSGGGDTYAYAVSDSGDVGISYSGGVGFWRSGVVSPVSVPAGFTYPFLGGGSDSGYLYGAVWDTAAEQNVAVRWSPQGTPTLLPNPQGHISGAYHGEGSYTAGSIQPPVEVGTGREAVLWTGTTYQLLEDHNGLEASAASAVNAAGVVVGFAYDNADCPTAAVKWVAGTMHLLPRLEGTSCSISADAINDAGQIVGYDSYQLRGLLWHEDRAYDLNQLVVNLGGASISRGVDIANDGRILAQATIDGVERAVILTPQP